jgi:hypothetical protein
MSYCRPNTIVGPILDKVVVSHDVEGASCEELGWRVNSYLLDPFTAPVRACRLDASVVAPRDYKASGCACANLCPLTQPSIVSLPASLWLKRKRDIGVDVEMGEKVDELTGHCFSFPSKPWWSRVGSHRRSCKSTYKTL